MDNHRRSVIRHAVDLPGRVFPAELGVTGGEGVAVVVKDLSLGGCSFVSTAPFPPGSLHRLRFHGCSGVAFDGAVLVRSCRRQHDNTFHIGTQHVVDPTILLGSGVEATLVTSELLKLVESGARPVWELGNNISAGESFAVDRLVASSVVATKDVTVTSAILDCTLDIGGRLIGPKAALIGGSAYVLRGVSLLELGSADGSPTHLSLGETLYTKRMLETVHSTCASNRAVIAQKNAAVSALRDQLADTLSHQDRERLTELMMEIPELVKRCERVEANGMKLRANENSRAIPNLQVKRMVHPGVTITAMGSRISIDRALPGPLTLGVSPDGKFEVLPTPQGHAESASMFAQFQRSAA